MKSWITLSIVLVFVAPVFAAQEDSVPNENATRAKIDKLIKECQESKRKATLGLLQEAIGLSISYGAPSWNLGDHEACFRFYAKTAKSLCSAFADATSATDAARRSIGDLKSALDRAAKSPDVDKDAWAMRYAFDKNQLACSMVAEHIQGLVEVGSQNFKRGQYEEAQDAYQTGATMLGELDGQALESIPGACRFAPFALGNALFAQKKYKDAIAPIAQGLKYLPEWPTLTFDLRGLHPSPDEYEEILKDLEDKAKASPDDADVQFLLGYEYHFTGKKSLAQEQFQKALKLDPAHVAKAFAKKSEMPAMGEPDAKDPKASKAR